MCIAVPVRKFICFLILAALLCLPLAAAAPQSDSFELPRISLGKIKGTPGSNVMMPLSLTPDPNNPLRSISVDIEFVSKSLVFQKTSQGLAAELADADVQASITKEESDDKGLKHVTLRVTASLPEAAPRSGLPDGLLAYLLFEISQDAQPFTITLSPTSVAATDLSSPPKKVASVGAEPGVVVIESLDAVYDRLVPELACFFFSH